MITNYRISFASFLLFLFLLPLFFLSSTILPLSISKAAFLALGATLIFVVFVFETFKGKKIVLASPIMIGGAILLSLVYLLSALISPFGHLGLFGYNLEIGTFGSMLLVSLLFVVASSVFTSPARVMEGYGVLVSAFSLVVLVGMVKVLSMGKLLNTGVLNGVSGNFIGSWTDYSIILGMVLVLSLFAIQMLRFRGLLGIFLYVLFGSSLFLSGVIYFAVAWQLIFIASCLTLIYFFVFEKKYVAQGESSYHQKRLILPLFLFFVSLIFVINPHISATKGNLSSVVSGAFGVGNLDVRPSLSSTLDIVGHTLKTNPLLGSGPNTFGYDWLLYKSPDINLTSFWNVVFPYGVGFLPTQIAHVGIVGSVIWVIFFLGFIWYGIRTMWNLPENKNYRFVSASLVLVGLFLWGSLFMYEPSIVILVLTLVFTGMLVGSGVHSEKKEVIVSSSNPRGVLVAVLLVACAVGSVAVGIVAYQRIRSVSYFQKALVLIDTSGSSPQDVATQLGNAALLVEHDIYFRTLSELEFTRAEAILRNATGTPLENKRMFEDAMNRSITAAQEALKRNKTYQNLIHLGAIYGSLVAKPLAVPLAYENAKAQYEEALKMNPSTPEVELLMARLEFDKGDYKKARNHLDQALQLKADYVEAYFLLTQIELVENKVKEAIISVRKSVELSPYNPGLYFQLGVLQYLNKDYQGSAEALTKAVELVPDYANARYYLALSLYELGKTPEAIDLIEALLVSNPHNELLTQVLTNLKSGKEPFSEKESPSPRSTSPVSNEGRQSRE